MSSRLPLIGFLPALLLALPLLAQPEKAPKAKANALPEGARLRLGSSGVQLGENVSAAALSPDGKLLAAVSNQRELTITDLATGKTLFKVEGEGEEAAAGTTMIFSPDGKRVAIAAVRAVIVVDLGPDGANARPLPLDQDSPQRVHSIAFSGDGKSLAVGAGQTGGMRKQFASVWDLGTLKQAGIVEVLQNASVGVTLSGDGKTLATWGKHFARMIGEDQTAGQFVQIWEIASGKEKYKIKIDRAGANVTQAAFSPDGKTLAVASGLSTFQFFDPDTGKEMRRFAGRRGLVTLLQFSADGKSLAAGSFDGTIQAWHTDTTRRFDLAPAPKSRVLSFAFPAPDKVLALALVGQRLDYWDAAAGPANNAPEGHQNPILSLTFSADGKTLATASNDGRVHYWDVATGKSLRSTMLVDEETQRLASAGVRLTTVMLSPDARYATTSNIYSPNSLRLWNLKSGQVVCDFEAERPVSSFGLAFTPNGERMLATVAKAISVWDTDSGREIAKLGYEVESNRGNPPRLAVSPDGKLVAVAEAGADPDSGTLVMKVALLDAADGKELLRFDGAAVFQNAGAVFSPDSKLLAMPSVGQSVSLVRTFNGKEWRRVGSPDPGGQVTTMSVAPDNRSVAIAVGTAQQPGLGGMASQPTAVEVYELASGRVRAQFRGHAGNVNALAFSPDGALLATGGADTTVMLWDLYAIPAGSKALAKADLDAAWASFAEEDADKAFVSVRRMLASPAEAVAYLKGRLKAASAEVVDAKVLDKRVADLDSDTFETRSRAFRDLEKVGSAAEEALKRARAGKVSLEMRRRIDDLLEKIDRSTLSSEELREARAVEVLERVGSDVARGVLEELARGAEQSRLTGEARRALERLRADPRGPKTRPGA